MAKTEKDSPAEKATRKFEQEMLKRYYNQKGVVCLMVQIYKQAYRDGFLFNHGGEKKKC